MFNLSFARISLVLAVQVAFFTDAQAAGVAVTKAQRHHSNKAAIAFVFTSVKPQAQVTIFTVKGREVNVPNTKYIDFVEIPKQIPKTLTTHYEIQPLMLSRDKLVNFSEKYPKSEPILKVSIDTIKAVITRYNSGEVRDAGVWRTKDEYAKIQENRKEQLAKVELRHAERKKRLEVEKQIQKELAAKQVAKGLMLYKGTWIPKDEANEKLANDRILARAKKAVKSMSVYDVRVVIFQTLDGGALASMYKNRNTRTYIPPSFVYLSHLEDSLVADDEEYVGDFFYSGTYTYKTKAGDSRSVKSYCVDKGTAIKVMVAKLSKGKRSTKNSRPVAKNDSKIPEVLREAKGSGSGFFIGNEGYFITNQHVVDKASKVEIYYKGKKHKAEVVTASKAVDLAVLKIDQKVSGLQIAEKVATIGEEVFAIGYPQPSIQGIDVKVTKGIISSLKGLGGDASTYQIDAAIQPGNSGGPLCSSEGLVVGVIVSKLDELYNARVRGSISQNVNYAVKSSELSAFLRSHDIVISTEGETARAGVNIKSISDAAKVSAMVIVQ